MPMKPTADRPQLSPELKKVWIFGIVGAGAGGGVGTLLANMLGNVLYHDLALAAGIFAGCGLGVALGRARLTGEFGGSLAPMVIASVAAILGVLLIFVSVERGELLPLIGAGLCFIVTVVLVIRTGRNRARASRADSE